ncbi:MAG: lysophospholipid acyltransferase family protein [Candidatus Aminicenantes bacterium]|nr:lysophospholipid acyltransferase family protein [Candidatus Aminicenantes bacterium]
MPFRKKLEQAAIDFLGRPLMSAWMKTLRLRVEGESAYRDLRRAGRPVVILVWHGKIFSAPWMFRRRNIMPLVSPSQDGELIARLIDNWGYKVIRGSGSHSMKRAWVIMMRELAAGGEVLIVPDGPRGPDRELKLGAVKLGAETGALLVPYTLGASRKKVFRSWDRFEVPRLFSRAVALFGEPIEIPRGIEGEALESERLRVERILRELDGRADALLARRPE